MGSAKEKCGKPTQDGSPCQQGAGCTIDHKPFEHLANVPAGSAAALKSQAVADADLPDTEDALSKEEANQIARDHQADPSDLAQLFNHSSKTVRRGVAKNWRTPGETLAIMLTDETHEQATLYAASNPSLPQSSQAVGLAKGGKVASAIAARSDLTDASKAECFKHLNPYVRQAYLSSENPDPAHLADAAADLQRSPGERCTAMLNPKFPDTVSVSAMKAMPDPYRTRLVESCTDPAQLAEIAADLDDRDFAKAAWASPNLGPDLHEAAPTHERRFVRRAYARNPAATADGLTVLAHDEDGTIQTRVADHRNTPESVLMALAATGGDVGYYASRNLAKKQKAAAAAGGDEQDD